MAIDFDVAAAAVLWRAEHPEPDPEPVPLWGEMDSGREPIRRVRLGVDY